MKRTLYLSALVAVAGIIVVASVAGVMAQSAQAEHHRYRTTTTTTVKTTVTTTTTTSFDSGTCLSTTATGPGTTELSCCFTLGALAVPQIITKATTRTATTTQTIFVPVII